jgi:ArsR family transcriptional regulator
MEGAFMSRALKLDTATMERKAAAIADLLGALGNERRLMILCKLVERHEATVGSLAEEVGLSQSALSQHLARMRQEGIVAFRRESQTLWYRIADARVETLFETLYGLFCRPGAKAMKKGTHG